MEKAIDTLFGNGLFSNIYFVDSNPAKVEFVEVKKISYEIREIKNSQSFDLERHSISKAGLLSLNIREKVKSSFMSVLDSIPAGREVKYFRRGLIRNLFSKKTAVIDHIIGAGCFIDHIIGADELSPREHFCCAHVGTYELRPEQ